jgi:hypothetical protein
MVHCSTWFACPFPEIDHSFHTAIRGSVPGFTRQGKRKRQRSYENSTAGERSNSSRNISVGTNNDTKRSGESDSKRKEFSRSNANDVGGDSGQKDSGSCKPKYRYSLAKKFIISEELDVFEEVSEGEDFFDSDFEEEENNVS